MLPWETVRAAITPLRFIFWGGLLWIFDVSFSNTINGRGFRFDILNDTVGTILITIGVARLAAAPVPGKYRAIMKYICAIALVSVVVTAFKHLVFPYPSLLEVLFTLFNMCQLAATILFSLAMRWFSEEAGLPRPAASWNVTLILFCLIYGLPLGLLYLAGLVAMLGNTSFNIRLGPAGLLLLPLFATPLIHLFVSTSRLKRAAETGMVQPPPPGGFPVYLPPDDFSAG